MKNEVKLKKIIGTKSIRFFSIIFCVNHSTIGSQTKIILKSRLTQLIMKVPLRLSFMITTYIYKLFITE